MPDPDQLEVGAQRQLELTLHDDTLRLATDVGLSDDYSLIVRQDIETTNAEGLLWVDVVVKKLIRSDGKIEYLVLDVLSVSTEPLETDTRESPDQEPDPDDGSDSVADNLDTIAEALVGELQLEQRTSRDKGAIVTDKYGERDKADSIPSSDRDRDVRARHRNSK